MIDLTLKLAAEHPHAHDDNEATAAAALTWALAQRNGIGQPYGSRMLTRLRSAFWDGVYGKQRPVANSNYDTPVENAYRAGAQLRSALLTLAR